jgi:hypothetical protein
MSEVSVEIVTTPSGNTGILDDEKPESESQNTDLLHNILNDAVKDFPVQQADRLS